jgi:gliding motility-associated lipoprotein GldD
VKGVGCFLIFLSLTIVSCDEAIVPKPYGYFRIDFPEKQYQLFHVNDCSLQFEYPSYGQVNPYRDKAGIRDCWYNLDMIEYDARLHLSYLPIDRMGLRRFIEESHAMAYKHQVKSSGIEEERIEFANSGVHGIIYHIRGNAASPMQFFVTDSVEHFLRGSLYFQNRPNADSIAPVLNYLKTDIYHLIETLQWEKSN